MAPQTQSKPWITAFHRRCIERKHKLHKESLINPSLLSNFKIYLNILRNLMSTAKNTSFPSKEHYTQELQNFIRNTKFFMNIKMLP